VFEFIMEILRPVNLPATLLLGFVVAYWLMVILGAVGVDSLDIDTDVDADVGSGGGPLMAAFEFFYLGEVPLTILFSIFALLFWIVTIISNHYFNANWSWVVALYLFIPCLVASLLATKVAVLPMVPFFRSIAAESNAQQELVGKSARVTTSELTDAFGQIEITHDGPPIVLNARSRGARFTQGDTVEIASFDAETNTYLVRLPKA
jgi:hypothetical protein